MPNHPTGCRCLTCELDAVTVPAPPLTAQDHADIMARATGSRSVTYTVERRNADGALTVLETATSSPR